MTRRVVPGASRRSLTLESLLRLCSACHPCMLTRRAPQCSSGPVSQPPPTDRCSCPWATPCARRCPTRGWRRRRHPGGCRRRERYAVSAPLRHKVLLDEDEMPTRWYNILHDLPTPPPPPLHPGTGQPVGPDDLAAIFPMDLIAQEVTTEQYVDIPQEVQDVYRLWRPSPLYRAHRLEKSLGTPARIYYKYEGVSPAGSHK